MGGAVEINGARDLSVEARHGVAGYFGDLGRGRVFRFRVGATKANASFFDLQSFCESDVLVELFCDGGADAISCNGDAAAIHPVTLTEYQVGRT